jgi:hypothetical protein
MPQHIKRLIVVFVVFILLFLILQHILKPVSFGKLGHYRELSIHENSVKPLYYAGAINCSGCHDSIRLIKAEGLHAQLNCEACHGPGLKHALYAASFRGRPLPDSLMLTMPNERRDCAICHEINAARIKILFDTINNTMVKQVNSMEHNLISRKTNKERKCVSCHNPHQP